MARTAFPQRELRAVAMRRSSVLSITALRTQLRRPGKMQRSSAGVVPLGFRHSDPHGAIQAHQSLVRFGSTRRSTIPGRAPHDCKLLLSFFSCVKTGAYVYICSAGGGANL